MEREYHVGDRIRYEYDTDMGMEGTATIEAVNADGWHYTVRLDDGRHASGRRGHSCNGAFSDMSGFYLNECHIVELLGSMYGTQISKSALEEILG